MNLRQEKLMQTTFLTQPLVMEAKAAFIWVLREESNIAGCRTYGFGSHISAESHEWLNDYNCKLHL
jgi:hypothetical protein